MPFQASTPEGRTAAQTASDAQQGVGNPLASVTVTGADTWIDANVTAATLAVFKAALKTIAHLLILLRDQQAKTAADVAATKKRLDRAGL